MFGVLPAEQLEAVVKIGVVKKFGKGESISLEGDPGNGFYMVAEGKVKIFKMCFAGKEHILHIFGPGEPFGEVPVYHPPVLGKMARMRSLAIVHYHGLVANVSLTFCEIL